MSSDLFTQEEIAKSLVRVAEITATFVGPEYWAAWCDGARAAAPEELDRWVSSQHWDFGMDVRNLFLHPGSKHRDQAKPFLGGDADSVSPYFCLWLALLARCGGDPFVAARAFLEAYGGPPFHWSGRPSPQLKMCPDEEL